MMLANKPRFFVPDDVDPSFRINVFRQLLGTNMAIFKLAVCLTDERSSYEPRLISKLTSFSFHNLVLLGA